MKDGGAKAPPKGAIMRILICVLTIVLSMGYVSAQDVTPEPEVIDVPIGNEIPYQRGISVVLYGNDTTMDINTVDFFDDLDSRNLGVDSIIFTFPIFMDGANSTVLYEDPELTPSVENIRIFIREAHSRGYSIWLKPLIDDSRTGTWRGAITPGGDLSNLQALDEWFTSYGALILQYAHLAQEESILGLVIGAELESLDKPQDKYTSRWSSLIAQVRAIYGGNVSYAKNWSPLELPGFAASLDVLMIDAFFDLQDLANDATSEQISQSWQRNWVGYLQGYAQMLQMPIMFAEVGIVPRVGAFRTPWNGNNGGAMDFSAQVRYYQGTCDFLRNFGESFNFRGAYWWAVGFYDHFENQRARADEQGILTYNFYDQPAEETLRQCYRG